MNKGFGDFFKKFSKGSNSGGNNKFSLGIFLGLSLIYNSYYYGNLLY
jgi:hypothetical protein